MWFGVLGRVEARGPDGRPVAIGGSVRRQLLAALLCRAGDLVPAATLIDDIWGATPPRTAAKTLQSHLVRLRDDLGRGGASVVATERGGYRIDLATEQFDAAAFEAAVDSGLAAVRRGDFQAAADLLRSGLENWRGEAYLDLADAPFLVSERMRLADLRAIALETRTDAELHLGAAATLVPELEARIRREPYRERSWEQLIVALYRAGRQSDALAAFRMARDRLASDLGVDPGPGLRELEQRILQQDPALLADGRRSVLLADDNAPRVAATSCPYRGLEGYDSADGSVFVGRERLTTAVVGRLVDAPVVVVTGPSGSGKSSLVRAGVITALRSGALPGSAAWRVELCTPVTVSHSTADLLVLDQAEQLFTVLDANARHAALRHLRDTVEAGSRLLLVIRGDYFAALAETAWLAAHAERGPVLVGRVRDDELARIIVEPARRAGVDVADDVVNAILEQATGQPQPLPLISVALVRAWAARDDGAITLASLDASGGVSAAIATTADAVFDALSPADQEHARRVLLRLAGRDGGRWVRRPARWSDTPGDVEATAIRALAAGRLVTIGEGHIELSHDALLESWPRLGRWLAERATTAALTDHLAAATAAWVAAGRGDADLYRGTRLAAAREWQRDHDDELSVDERAFLAASTAAAESDLQNARRDAARMAQARSRILRIAVGLALALILAVVAGVLAVRARTSADNAARSARAAALAAVAGRVSAASLSSPDLATSALLAAAGYRLHDSPQARGALLAALQRGESAAWRLGTPARDIRLDASADGSRLYVFGNDALVRVIDTTRRRIIATYDPHATSIEGLIDSGRQLVVSGPDQRSSAYQVAVLDAATGRPVTVLDRRASAGFIDPAVSADGRWVVAAQSPGIATPSSAVAVWDASKLARPPRTIHFGSAVIAVAAARTAIAVATSDGVVRLLRPADLHVIGSHKVPGVHGDVNNGGALASPLVLAPDGRWLAFASGSAVSLLDGAHLSRPGRVLPAMTATVTKLQFRPDSSELGAGASDGAVRLYRVATATTAADLTGEAGSITGLAWAGHTDAALFTTGLDSQVVAWRTQAGNPLLKLDSASVPSAVLAAQFGTHVLGTWPSLTGYTPGTAARLFDLDLASGALRSWPARLSAPQIIDAVSATPSDSRAIVTVTNTQTNKTSWMLWDIRAERLISEIPVPRSADTSHYLVAALDRTGHTAAVSLGRGRIGVIAVPSGRLLRTFPVHFARVNRTQFVYEPIAFGPDGEVAVDARDEGSAVGANSRLGLLDLRTGRLVEAAPGGEVSALAWSHDGRRIAVGTYNGGLGVYDAHTLGALHASVDAQAGYVDSVAFAPDDRTLVTAGTDAAMNLWDAETLQRIGPRIESSASQWWWAWYAPNGNVSGLAPDTTAPGSDRERPFEFPARATTWLQLACRLAGTPMTRRQWSQLVGNDVAYQPVCGP